MKCLTYVVARDFGFAPNPFGGFCTLAACKPKIRGAAAINDWVIGMGAKSNKLSMHVVYAMKVTEKLTFDEYWQDSRFQYKKPVLNGSLQRAYGDNIYHTVDGNWRQSNSHHSNPDGSVNNENVKKDTSVNWVLISNEFYYFGKNCILLPDFFEKNVSIGRYSKYIKDISIINSILDFIKEKSEPKNILNGFPNWNENFVTVQQ